MVGLDGHELPGLKLLGLEPLVGEVLSGPVDVISLGISILDAVVGIVDVGETQRLGLSLSG